MGCGCGGSTGGSTGGSGGCGGGARPEIEVPADAPLFEELPHEEDSEPAAEQASGEPLLIASSQQECSHTASLANNHSAHIWFDELHGVVDRHACSN